MTNTCKAEVSTAPSFMLSQMATQLAVSSKLEISSILVSSTEH